MYHVEEKISTFIRNYFPSYVRESGDMFVKFIETYYKFLESENQTTMATRKFLDYRNTNLAVGEFFQFLRGEFMQGFPEHLLVDERILISRILDFYKAKGTKDSYRLLFRILYNEEIEFYQPGTDILRLSDGRWQRNAHIAVRLYANTSYEDCCDITEIRGATSEAEAEIFKVEQVSNNYIYYTKLFSNDFEGDFVEGEIIYDVTANTAIGTVSSTLAYDPGNYEGTFGFLSADKYIQDNYYYQEFSYEIKSTKSLNQYKKILEQLVHPVGTKMFGKVNLGDDALEMLSTYNTIMTIYGADGQEAFSFQIYEFLTPTYTADLEKELGSIAFIGGNTSSSYDSLMRKTNSFGTRGLEKLIMKSSGVIADYGSRTILDFYSVPIIMMTNRKLFVSEANTFLTLELTGNTNIRIDDWTNTANVAANVDIVYNDNMFSIKSAYPYASTSNSIYYLV